MILINDCPDCQEGVIERWDGSTWTCETCGGSGIISIDPDEAQLDLWEREDDLAGFEAQ